MNFLQKTLNISRHYENIREGKIKFERENMKAGIYFYEFIERNYAINTGKLLIID